MDSRFRGNDNLGLLQLARVNEISGGFLEHNFPTGGGSVFREEHVTRSFGKLWKT